MAVRSAQPQPSWLLSHQFSLWTKWGRRASGLQEVGSVGRVGRVLQEPEPNSQRTGDMQGLLNDRIMA